tara:strand:- start:560 stop:1417 length:858 start_codon:yes stop_codon:yes gene_type:complete
MNKRTVLAPVKKPVEKTIIPEDTPVSEPRDFDDKDIFALPKNATSSSKSKNQSYEENQTSDGAGNGTTESPDTLPTEHQMSAETKQSTVKNKKRDYSHLTKAREKSLEARRKKAQEKDKMQVEIDAYKEKLEFERLTKKFSVAQVDPGVRVTAAAQPEMQYEPPIEKKTQPVPKSVASVNPHHDMSGSMFDYDRLIGGVADRLSQQNDYYAQLESDIRADERKKAETTYQEQLKSWEKQQHRHHQREQQAYGALSQTHRRNNVFDRSAKLRETYTERYKNNWYTN